MTPVTSSSPGTLFLLQLNPKLLLYNTKPFFTQPLSPREDCPFLLRASPSLHFHEHHESDSDNSSNNRKATAESSRARSNELFHFGLRTLILQEENSSLSHFTDEETKAEKSQVTPQKPKKTVSPRLCHSHILLQGPLVTTWHLSVSHRLL